MDFSFHQILFPNFLIVCGNFISNTECSYLIKHFIGFLDKKKTNHFLKTEQLNETSSLFLKKKQLVIVGCGPWFLPVLFYCITCCILQTLLEDLHQRISPLRPFTLNLTTFRMEHRKLCEVVEFADKMLRLPMFGMVSVYLPLICFNFYLVVNSSPGHKFVSHISTLIFFLFAVCTLAIIMVFGSKVNEQVK